MTGGRLVLLIGGHSGAGKSTLAAQVARHMSAAFLEADDIRMAIQRVTTPEQLPALHWRYGQWLRAEAERRGQPVVPPRPYDTLFDRVLAALAWR